MRHWIAKLALILIPALTFACGPATEEGVGTSTGGEGAEPAADTVELTFPHVLNEEHPVHKAIVRFAEEVEGRSDGTMVVKIFPGGSMGTEQELVDNVALGTNDFTKVSSTILETRTELAKVYALPYLFRSKEHLWKVLNGEIGTELLDMATDKGIKGIAYYDAGMRSFYTRDGVINTPEDLNGQKIRVQKSPMMQQMVSALGGLPQPIAWSELYTALDTGVVDGAENNIPSYYTTQHYKVAPHYSFSEHVAVPDMVLMSTNTWDSLTEEQQQIIMAAAKASSDFQREIWDAAVDENIADMKEQGVTFHYPDKAPFIDQTASIREGFEGTEVGEYADRIAAVR